MRDVNRVILVGRLGGIPTLMETKKGNQVAHFSLATSRWVKGEEPGQPGTEATQWHRITAWGKLAQTCGRELAKGQLVYVEGSFRSSEYTGKDGLPRQGMEVHADRVHFLGTKVKRADSAIESAGPQAVEAAPQLH
ncbi:MAG: single-stranded DNA-binding protein [Bdellovibrionales bacterium]|nr:single-stranded DNA-binding protein [Bdellovibrionales bacterium]